MSAFVASQVVNYAGPYPYIDGLILQVTQRIGSIEVRHEARQAGQSTYTLRRLIRLWMAAWVNFSVLPLRVATVLGLTMAAAGMVALVVVAWLWLNNVGPSYGFGWLMAALLVFSGTQLVLLGLIGEYIGRMFLTVNQRPQAIVREVVTGAAAQPAAVSEARPTPRALRSGFQAASGLRQRAAARPPRWRGALASTWRRQRRCARPRARSDARSSRDGGRRNASATATRTVAGPPNIAGRLRTPACRSAGFILQVAEQATRQ